MHYSRDLEPFGEHPMNNPMQHAQAAVAAFTLLMLCLLFTITLGFIYRRTDRSITSLVVLAAMLLLVCGAVAWHFETVGQLRIAIAQAEEARLRETRARVCAETMADEAQTARASAVAALRQADAIRAAATDQLPTVGPEPAGQ